MCEQLQHELELAKSKNLILEFHIKTVTFPMRHGKAWYKQQVWYIKLRDDTTQQQIQKLQTYIEQSPDVEYAIPLLDTDTLGVFMK